MMRYRRQCAKSTSATPPPSWIGIFFLEGHRLRITMALRCRPIDATLSGYPTNLVKRRGRARSTAWNSAMALLVSRVIKDITAVVMPARTTRSMVLRSRLSAFIYQPDRQKRRRARKRAISRHLLFPGRKEFSLVPWQKNHISRTHTRGLVIPTSPTIHLRDPLK